MKHPELPPEVADLFKRDGAWSQTREDLFFFTCECDNSAVCRCERHEEEDRWLRNCATKECDFYGEHLVIFIDIDEDESKKRHKKNKRAEEIEENSGNGGSMIQEIEHYLGIAAQLGHKDTDYAAMLDRIVEVIRKYVFIGRDEALIMALWVVHTWCIRAAEFTPYIHLRSSMPREGKSRVLDVLGYLCARPIRMSDPTPAAIADVITIGELMGSDPPTFLWDEIDSAYERRPELREYVNNGFQRGNLIIRAKGRVKYTFAPKVMAGLTELPATVHDRSFRMDMTRAKDDEKPERMTPRERRALEVVASEIHMLIGAFAERHMETLIGAEPELPSDLDDRAQDIAEPLAAIADAAGGDWPDKSRAAFVKVRTAMQRAGSAHQSELLLMDIKEIFGTIRQSIYSQVLVDKLVSREDRPWKGMGLTQWKLARMLHEFVESPGGPRIASQRIRIGGRKAGTKLAAGYKRKQFEDAWSRYVASDDK